VQLSGSGFFDRIAYSTATTEEKSEMENFCKSQEVYAGSCDMVAISQFYKDQGYTVSSAIPDGFLIDQCIVCEEGSTEAQCMVPGFDNPPPVKQLFIHFASKSGDSQVAPDVFKFIEAEE
jgi:hypothetical protein